MTQSVTPTPENTQQGYNESLYPSEELSPEIVDVAKKELEPNLYSL